MSWPCDGSSWPRLQSLVPDLLQQRPRLHHPDRQAARPHQPHPPLTPPPPQRGTPDDPLARSPALDHDPAPGTGRRPRRDQGVPRPRPHRLPSASTPTSGSASNATLSISSAALSTILPRLPTNLTPVAPCRHAYTLSADVAVNYCRQRPLGPLRILTEGPKPVPGARPSGIDPRNHYPAIRTPTP